MSTNVPATIWRGSQDEEYTNGTAAALVDGSGVAIVDGSGVSLVDSGGSVTTKPATAWSEDDSQ